VVMDSSSESTVPHMPSPVVGRVAAVAIGAAAFVAVGAAVQTHMLPKGNTEAFLDAHIRSVNQFAKCAESESCGGLKTDWKTSMASVARIMSPTPTDGEYTSGQVSMNKWLAAVDATHRNAALSKLFSSEFIQPAKFKEAFGEVKLEGTTALTSTQKSAVLKMLESSADLPNPFLKGADADNQKRMEHLHNWMKYSPEYMVTMGKNLINPAGSLHSQAGFSNFKTMYMTQIAKVTAMGDCYSSHGAGAIAALNAAVVAQSIPIDVETALPDKDAAGTAATKVPAAVAGTDATTVTVADGTKVPKGSFIKIGQEILWVSDVVTNALTVKRGQCGTEAAAIAQNAAVTTAAKMKFEQSDLNDLRNWYIGASQSDQGSANAQMALQMAAVPALQ